MIARPLAAALLVALAAAPLRAQDAPAPAAAPAQDDAKARKDAKVRRFLEAARWKDSLMAGLDASFDAQAKVGRIPAGFAKKFKETADFKALEVLAVEVWSEALDEATLDAAIAFHESEAGKKFSEASLGILGKMNEKMMPWAMEQGAKTMEALMADPPAEGAEENPALRSLKAAKRSANETSAIATLRNLASCQAQIQASGKIDVDADGIGEYGTLLEMAGAVGVRKDPEFAHKGTPVNPPILSPKMKDVGPDGVVKKSGYCYRLYLPDTADRVGFVGETGPADKVALAGGTGKVGVDFSEVMWCAYAWPEKRGESGNRAFFVNQAGDVMQSANEIAKWSGEKAPPGPSAFRGTGITGLVAVGTSGQDGDVWKVTN